MAIDVLFLIFLLLAIVRGLRHGFIIAVVSAVAWIIGIAAAIKLSAVVAMYGKEHMHLPSRWLPVLAFLAVFVAVVLGLRAIAKGIEKVVDLAMMGWANKLLGVLLYAFLYVTTLSVLLFYAVQLHLLSSHTLSTSVSYPYIRPLGPTITSTVDGLFPKMQAGAPLMIGLRPACGSPLSDEFGKFVPWFKGMFAQLEDFFGQIGNRL